MIALYAELFHLWKVIAIYEQTLEVLGDVFLVCVCAYHALSMGGPGKDLTKSLLVQSTAHLL